MMSQAIRLIGNLYDLGSEHGFYEDIAFEYLYKGASLHDPECSFMIGRYYYFGKSVTKDYLKAFYYFNFAAKNNYIEAMTITGYMYEKGLGVSTKNYDLAIEWYERAAKHNIGGALYNLGNIYTKEEYGKLDKKKGFYYYKKAAENNYTKCFWAVGSAYLNGRGVKKNYKKAVDWFIKSIDNNGHPAAYWLLGYCYSNGYGVSKDKPRAIELYKKASEFNIKEAQYNLGLLYLYGNGVTQNHEIAKWYLRLAVKNGDRQAKKLLDEIS